MPKIDMCARLLNRFNRIERTAKRAHPTYPLHDGAEIRSGRAVEPKAELGPAGRIMYRASATNERLARRAAKIDASSPGQSLLGHGDAAPSRRCCDGSGQAGRPAAENHYVVVAAFSVRPTRRVALAQRRLVVNVRGGKLYGPHRVSPLHFV
jgi:hypothetical protein